MAEDDYRNGQPPHGGPGPRPGRPPHGPDPHHHGFNGPGPHHHQRFDMGCQCADDQIPVFSKVGRGLRGDSAKLELIEDGDLNTYVRGLTYDAATGGWSTEWTSGNINAGKVSMNYMFFPDDDPKTFTMTFRLERPGRQMWEWTTPRIPYTWDEAGHDPISAGPSRGLFVKHIDPAADWFDKMTLPEGMTPDQREGIGAPLDWDHDSSALPFSQATPYVNTLTWGVHPQFDGDTDNTLHGDIPVLRDAQEARIIGITEEALHRLLTQDPDQLPLKDDLSYTHSGIPVTIVGGTILELFKNTADDIYGRIGDIETGIGGLWYKTIPCILALLCDDNKQAGETDPEQPVLAIPSSVPDAADDGTSTNTHLLAYRPGTITITWSDKLPYYTVSMKCGDDLVTWNQNGTGFGYLNGWDNSSKLYYRRHKSYTSNAEQTDLPQSYTARFGGRAMRIGMMEYIVPCWMEKQTVNGARCLIPIDFKSDKFESVIGRKIQAINMDCEVFTQGFYGRVNSNGYDYSPAPSNEYGNAMEFTGVGNLKVTSSHPWYNDPNHIFIYIIMRSPGETAPRTAFDFNRNYTVRFEGNVQEYQGGE